MLSNNQLLKVKKIKKDHIEKSAISCISYLFQVDIFNGLNNDLLAREGLVAIDMKHSVSPGPVSVTPVGTPLSHSSLRDSMSVTPGPITHIKQDMMYPASMGSPAPPNTRQVNKMISFSIQSSAALSRGDIGKNHVMKLSQKRI